MTVRTPTLRWDDDGRLYLGDLRRHVAFVHAYQAPFALDAPESVGLIYLPGLERPRSGGTAEVRHNVETAVRGWLAGASA